MRSLNGAEYGGSIQVMSEKPHLSLFIMGKVIKECHPGSGLILTNGGGGVLDILRN